MNYDKANLFAHDGYDRMIPWEKLMPQVLPFTVKFWADIHYSEYKAMVIRME